MKTEPTTPHYDSHLTTDQLGWDATSHYVTSLANDPDFIERSEALGGDKYSIEYADLLAQFAEEKVAQQEGLIEEKVATQIRLVANAPYMTQASILINDYNERRKSSKLSRAEWDHLGQLKEQAVWYNQMLSNYLYENSDESFGSISQAISDQVIDHSQDVGSSAQIADGVIRGARTEAATRHLLEAAGIPFRTATIKEDLRGADIILMLPTGEYDIDIKKSLDKLAASQGGYDFTKSGEMFVIKQDRNGKKKLLLFPGFTDTDLGDKLKLDEKTTNERKDIVAAQLMRASLKIAA